MMPVEISNCLNRGRKEFLISGHSLYGENNCRDFRYNNKYRQPFVPHYKFNKVHNYNRPFYSKLNVNYRNANRNYLRRKGKHPVGIKCPQILSATCELSDYVKKSNQKPNYLSQKDEKINSMLSERATEKILSSVSSVNVSSECDKNSDETFLKKDWEQTEDIEEMEFIILDEDTEEDENYFTSQIKDGEDLNKNYGEQSCLNDAKHSHLSTQASLSKLYLPLNEEETNFSHQVNFNVKCTNNALVSSEILDMKPSYDQPQSIRGFSNSRDSNQQNKITSEKKNPVLNTYVDTDNKQPCIEREMQQTLTKQICLKKNQFLDEIYSEQSDSSNAELVPTGQDAETLNAILNELPGEWKITDDSEYLDPDNNDVSNSSSKVNETVHKENLQNISKQLKDSQEHRKTVIHQGKAKIQSALDQFREPLIGLEYIIELWKVLETHFLHYYCILCARKLSEANLLPHIVDVKHRLMYLEKHIPSCCNQFPKTSSQFWPEGCISYLENICQHLENIFGRNLIFITTEQYFIAHLAQLKKCVNASKHYCEKNAKLSDIGNLSLYLEKKKNSNKSAENVNTRIQNDTAFRTEYNSAIQCKNILKNYDLDSCNENLNFPVPYSSHISSNTKSLMSRTAKGIDQSKEGIGQDAFHWNNSDKFICNHNDGHNLASEKNNFSSLSRCPDKQKSGSKFQHQNQVGNCSVRTSENRIVKKEEFNNEWVKATVVDDEHGDILRVLVNKQIPESSESTNSKLSTLQNTNPLLKNNLNKKTLQFPDSHSSILNKKQYSFNKDEDDSDKSDLGQHQSYNILEINSFFQHSTTLNVKNSKGSFTYKRRKCDISDLASSKNHNDMSSLCSQDSRLLNDWSSLNIQRIPYQKSYANEMDRRHDIYTNYFSADAEFSDRNSLNKLSFNQHAHFNGHISMEDPCGKNKEGSISPLVQQKCFKSLHSVDNHGNCNNGISSFKLNSGHKIPSELNINSLKYENHSTDTFSSPLDTTYNENKSIRYHYDNPLPLKQPSKNYSNFSAASSNIVKHNSVSSQNRSLQEMMDFNIKLDEFIRFSKQNHCLVNEDKPLTLNQNCTPEIKGTQYEPNLCLCLDAASNKKSEFNNLVCNNSCKSFPLIDDMKYCDKFCTRVKSVHSHKSSFNNQKLTLEEVTDKTIENGNLKDLQKFYDNPCINKSDTSTNVSRDFNKVVPNLVNRCQKREGKKFQDCDSQESANSASLISDEVYNLLKPLFSNNDLPCENSDTLQLQRHVERIESQIDKHVPFSFPFEIPEKYEDCNYKSVQNCIPEVILKCPTKYQTDSNCSDYSCNTGFTTIRENEIKEVTYQKWPSQLIRVQIPEKKKYRNDAFREIYYDEWAKFYKRRKLELIEAGGTPDDYDFEGEWIEYWECILKKKRNSVLDPRM